jgi:beta-phosphoglucomutase
MSKNIGVAFDLEGTIVDVESAHHQAHLQIAKQLGLNLTIPEAILKIKHFIGGPDDLIMKEILELSGQSGNLEQIYQEDKKMYKNNLSNTVIKTRDGFLKCLENFKKNGVALSIGSLTEKDEAKILIEQAGLDKLIPASNIVYRESVKHLKPAPDVFFETAKRMDINSTDQIVFEDSPRGVMAAISAGSKMVVGMPVYNSPDTRKALLEAGANYVFESWKDVDVDGIISELK